MLFFSTVASSKIILNFRQWAKTAENHTLRSGRIPIFAEYFPPRAAYCVNWDRIPNRFYREWVVISVKKLLSQ